MLASEINVAHASELDLLSTLDIAKQQIEVGGQYTHYKNLDHTYTVLDIAIQESDDKPAVIYQADYGDRITFVRSASSWFDKVNSDKGQETRFAKKTE